MIRWQSIKSSSCNHSPIVVFSKIKFQLFRVAFFTRYNNHPICFSKIRTIPTINSVAAVRIGMVNSDYAIGKQCNSKMPNVCMRSFSSNTKRSHQVVCNLFFEEISRYPVDVLHNNYRMFDNIYVLIKKGCIFNIPSFCQ